MTEITGDARPPEAATLGAVFPRALGEDFGRLHPMMQRRFGVSIDGGYACIAAA